MLILLGYNYGSSEWYETSCGVFNKMYVTSKIEKQKENKKK